MNTLAAQEIAAGPTIGRPRNTNLDALRGVAVLMVLGRHIHYFGVWTRVGWAGVDLFFVLSGFLISGLLFDEWRRSGSIDFRRFYLRRAFKILPSFWALLLATWLVHLLAPSGPFPYRALLAELTFTQNYFPGLWVQTWSLAVEEHFYLLLPVALWLMYCRYRRDPNPFHWLPSCFFAVAAFEIALRILTAAGWIGRPDWPYYLAPTHLRLDGLLFGVLLAYYRRWEPEKFRTLARGRAGIILAALAIGTLLAVSVENTVMHTLGFTVVYLGFGAILARVVEAQPHAGLRPLLLPLALIGYCSYSIYLWQGWVAFPCCPQLTLLGFLRLLFLALLLGIVITALIEYPALRLRDKLIPR